MLTRLEGVFHIAIMAKENFHSQFEETATPSGRPEETTKRVLRRLIKEAILPLARWAESQDSVTASTILTLARKPSLIDQATNLDAALERYCGKTLELIGLKNPLDFTQTLVGKPNELTRRMAEIGQKNADEFLLIAWHQDHGLIAASWPDTEDLPKDLRPQTKILCPWPEKEDKDPIALWAWDKRNFTAQRE